MMSFCRLTLHDVLYNFHKVMWQLILVAVAISAL